MLIAATFNRGKYMYKSREGGCATAEQKHRTERKSQRDLPSSSHSALYSGSNLFGLFPKNKSSFCDLSLLLLDFTEAAGNR